jgi:hypothetical protein
LPAGLQLVRDARGAITSFDPTGSLVTIPTSINDAGDIAGYYLDATSHGLVRDAKGTITTFDPPGSIATVSSSINNIGEITGYYIDPWGVPHGFVRSR